MARKKLKIMLTGNNGQVGWELQRTLVPLGEVVALGRQELDLANPAQIKERVREVKPGVIVNAAAYTAVDRAEEEPDLARAVNGTAPGVLAGEAKRLGAFLVHYSTDYVFDGTKNAPYTEADQPCPVNIYGKTKLEGERAVQAAEVPHFIFRVSWVYGLRGRNFLQTILRLAGEKDELKIVDDQIGAPTWSRMIAEATAQILARVSSPDGVDYSALKDVSGIYHLSADGQTSWYGFARMILDCAPQYLESYANKSVQLQPILTADYQTEARRPKYSVLDNDRLERTFSLSLPDWSEQLEMAMQK